MNKTLGFTLLEVLIAVSITAIIGVAATQLLSNIVQAKQSTEVRAEKLAILQRFNNILSRDVEQFVARSIRDEYDSKQNDLTLDSGEYYLQFSRLGWRNSPLSKQPRSRIQRVAYQMQPLDSDVCKLAKELLEKWQVNDEVDYCLVRYYWQTLDRVQSEPKAQMILPAIMDFQASVFVDNADKKSTSARADWASSWSFRSASSSNMYPVALRIIFTLPTLGEITRTWSLAHTRFEVKKP